MGCCCEVKREVESEIPRASLNNLQYLELVQQVREAQTHAKEHHTKEKWKCWFWHHWHLIVDADYDTHRVCHNCGKYRSWNAASHMNYY